MNCLFFFLLLNGIFITLVDSQTLKSLFIVLRHGDRSIATERYPSLCPTDDHLRNQARDFTDGVFQLTKKGRQRLFNVGKLLGEVYIDFLSENSLTVRDLEVRSIGMDRAIDTAQLFVNGFLKQTRTDGSHTVPIHSRPFASDSMFNAHEPGNCPTADKTMANILKNDQADKANIKHQKLFEYLSSACNTTVDDKTHLAIIYDILLSEIASELVLPEWATNDTLEEMKDIWTSAFALFGSNKIVRRLRSGIFVNDLLQKAKKVFTSEKEMILNDDQEVVKKVYIYSAYDIFIKILMTSLRIDNGLVPPVGSALIFELYHNDTSHSLDWEESNLVRILFYNETDFDNYNNHDSNYYQLKISDCMNSSYCTMKQFKNVIKDVILDQNEWEKECGLAETLPAVKNNETVRSKNNDFLITIVILVIIAINLLLFIFIYFREH